jgi:hypothetical protein
MLKTKAVQFMDTPDSYYDQLPKRLEVFGIRRIDENPDDLRRLRILIDGNKEHSYLLQIFMKDAASLYGERDAGRSSTRSSSARETRDSARGTSARCSRASSATRRPRAGSRSPGDDRAASVRNRPPEAPHPAAASGGELAFEECFTQEGFEGPYTIGYHLRAPHTQRSRRRSTGGPGRWTPPRGAGSRSATTRHRT